MKNATTTTTTTEALEVDANNSAAFWLIVAVSPTERAFTKCILRRSAISSRHAGECRRSYYHLSQTSNAQQLRSSLHVPRHSGLLHLRHNALLVRAGCRLYVGLPPTMLVAEPII